MSRKKKIAENPDVPKTRLCSVCNIEVKLGFGGEANWTTHVQSMAHTQREKSSKNTKPITSFFQKAPGPPRPSASVHHVGLSPPRLFNAPPFLFHNNNSKSVPSAEVSPLFARLHNTIKSLPHSIPLGTPSDILAAFSGDPTLAIEDGDDAWESIDRALNRVVGFGTPVDEISALIRRGEFGMDGFYNWLRLCVSKLRIDEVLLEGKINHLIDAMVKHGANADLSATSQQVRDSDTDDAGKINHPDAISTAIPCPGYSLTFLVGQTGFGSYPWLMHTIQEVPWSVTTSEKGLVLRSLKPRCTGVSPNLNPDEPRPCISCRLIDNHDILFGIRDRSENGAKDKTAWRYLSPEQMITALERKTEIINTLKLKVLSILRMLGIRNRHIEGWKHLSIAIGSEDIPRIKSLLSASQRAGASVFSILERVKKAAARAYSPKGYEERDFKLGYLIYKIGGRSAANIAHRALGIPSVDTSKHHIGTSPLISSPKFPTAAELRANVSMCFINSFSTVRDERIRGMTIQVDEIKIQERLRWDHTSNQILGVCREHTTITEYPLALEFRSINQADALLQGLKEKKVHLATEATVIGASILSDNPNEYTTKAFAISGSCKAETYHAQEKLLRLAVDSLQILQLSAVRLYCLCSDGDARRRRAFMGITMDRELDPSSPIHGALSALSLFNLRCGGNDITCDFDWKHVFKRFRNTGLRQKGFEIDEETCTTSIMKFQLVKDGMDPFTADTLLAPNDRQDVVLMVKLLHAISLLRPLPESEQRPLVRSTRRILILLGHIYGSLLGAYLDVTLSLHEQLVNLSTAAHLILAIYHVNKGGFIPVQTFFDVMSMIKNVYFSVAKTQIDDPSGSFYIILLGTDGLEKVFGQVRTMVGNDTNADQLQLTNRIDGAVQCVKILEEHPEWGGQSRRLKLNPLSKNTGEISSKYDHINPKSWKGDVQVRNVVLSGAWSSGRRDAENHLQEAMISPPFSRMEAEGGYDILCPFGGSKVVLLDGTLVEGERQETEEEMDHVITPQTETAIPSNPPNTSDRLTSNEGPASVDDTNLLDDDNDAEELEPDMDDTAGLTEVSSGLLLAAESQSAAPKYDPWIMIDNKRVHKATILRYYSTPLAVTDSKDRLKRVRGFSQYDETAREVSFDNQASSPDEAESNARIYIQDLALTLVRCNRRIFLAIFQILGIRINAQNLQSLPAQHIHEPNVRIHGQIMKLSILDTAHQPDKDDWEWTGAFEAGATFQNAEGRWIDLINPSVQRATRGRNTGKDTYTFRSAELRTMAASLQARLGHDIHHLPEVRQTASFPYRSLLGSACFHCDENSGVGDIANNIDVDTCRACRNQKVILSTLTGPALVAHMGGHILHDFRLKGAITPCGFCLSEGSLCYVNLTVNKKGSRIDIKNSRCAHLQKLTLKAAAKFSKESPCTNHPLICPLCPPKTTLAVWKYNLRYHILTVHPTANVDLYSNYFSLTEAEMTLMKAVYQKVPRKSKKSKKAIPLPISDGHSTRTALQELDHTSPNSDVEMEGDDADEGDEISEDDASEDEDAHNEPSWPDEPSLKPQVDTGGDTQIRGSRLRKRRRLFGDDEENVCADDGCDGVIAANDLLVCDAPGCGLTYHLSCQGLLEKLIGGWFCDDECKKNAGFRVGHARKRRRKE